MTASHPIFPSYSLLDAEKEVAVSVIKYGDDKDQILEFYGDNNSEKRTLLLIHGGYWRELFDREHMRPLAVALAKEGFNVVLPEFRRVAGAPETTLRDLSFVISTLKEIKLTLIGYSSGGHLALLLADKFAFTDQVIGLAPVTDMSESQRLELGRNAVREWLGDSADNHPELDPMLRPPIGAKTIFIQGVSDERVPINLTRNYVAEMAKHGHIIELVELATVTHFEMMNIPSPTYDAIVAALN
ncbi:MAG: alpha/beta hydrolase family protein [Candidatus Planktophila sp.]